MKPALAVEMIFSFAASLNYCFIPAGLPVPIICIRLNKLIIQGVTGGSVKDWSGCEGRISAANLSETTGPVFYDSGWLFPMECAIIAVWIL